MRPRKVLWLSFEICWTLLFLAIVVLRWLSVVTFEVGYDETALMGLAFGVGMLVREIFVG